MNLRCIVVDDEPLAVKMIENYIARTPFLTLEASFTDPVQALSEIRSRRPELVFMDIQMPDLSGLELSRMVQEGTRIIFTTAFKQYAFESYEVSAVDFLLKPIRYQKFLEAAEKAQRLFGLVEAATAASQSQQTATAADKSIFIKTDSGMQKVFLEDILYFEGMKDYVRIHLAEGQTLLTHITMKALEDLLPTGSFMRVHRSYIVSLDRIDSVSAGSDISIGGAFIHVSESFRPAFDVWLQSRSLVS
ncbi:MAG: response regulator transcription factor [Bacteroidales bacterium]|nr:response regulator transcription factor [Bacteroidales bacterium]MBR5054869.1 response regulator transcription factor [Bacteroidales bacterium]